MSNTQTPLQLYEQNIVSFSSKLAACKKKRSNIAWLRFAVFIITIVIAFSGWISSNLILAAIIIAGIACFLYIVSVDANLKQNMANMECLLKINQDEILTLEGDYYKRPDGKVYEPAAHAYAQDLDIFGTASIYQYINRCTAEQSCQLLASRLLNPMEKTDILKAQQAVRELAPKVEWRQQYQAYGMESPVSNNTESKIVHWLKEPFVFKQNYWRLISYLFPVFTLGCVALYVAEIIEWSLLSLIVFVCFVISTLLSKKIQVTYMLLSKTVTEITTLFAQLNHLENEPFGNDVISKLKNNIESKNNHKASVEINKLSNILNRFDMRLNVFAFFFLNTFLLWDLWQMLALNRWKEKNSQAVPNWFNAIAEAEVLSSLAALSFNQPTWCFPEIAEQHFTLHGEDIGHPLIDTAKRVDNPFNLEGTAKVSLITGSNMGGKSTFLRSIGVNVVLSLMGSPVCAKSFSISPVRLMSSMRIADNLAENTSTFYAELKKLQQIIEAVNRNEKIFILLDEILRGTNSLDRHTGSKALIKQLIKQNAVAIIATHDVELTVLKNEYPNSIANYHFDVQVDKNDELYFDFKLKEGVCTSLNASILMRKIGIEMG